MDEKTYWIRPDAIPALVSVIIPTYNRCALLHRAIESVYNQSYRPIECIIVDDGSTDNTSEIIEKWEARTEKNFIIRHLQQEHTGAPSARNQGTKECTGEFIQYLDSDDILFRNKLSDQVTILNRFRTIDAVFGDWQMGTPEHSHVIKACRQKDLIAQFLGGRCIAIFSFLMRRNLVNTIGPWDETLVQNDEIDFHIRAVLAEGTCVYRKGTCGLWVTHDGERITTIQAKQQSTYYFLKKWLHRLQELNCLTDLRERAISNALFYCAMSPDFENKKLKTEMLSLAWDLHLTRPEFYRWKMRILRTLLGKKPAIRVWLYRADRHKRHH